MLEPGGGGNLAPVGPILLAKLLSMDPCNSVCRFEEQAPEQTILYYIERVRRGPGADSDAVPLQNISQRRLWGVPGRCVDWNWYQLY
jgi:hypothetical protein